MISKLQRRCTGAAFSAVQLLCLGILGEYVGRMYSSIQSGPTHYVAYDSLEDPALARAQDTPSQNPRAQDARAQDARAPQPHGSTAAPAAADAL